MNTERLREYCATCNNEIVTKILKKFNLTCPIHEMIPKNCHESFYKTFSKLFEVNDNEIRTMVQRHANSTQFRQLQKLEFGANMLVHLRNPNLISNLAFISSLAEEFKRQIILICDFYSLNCAHDGKQVIVFEPSERISDDPVGCLLFDFNSYHPLNFSDELLNLGREDSFCKISLRQQNNNEEITTNGNNPNDSFDRDIDFVEPGSRGSVAVPVVDLGAPAETPVMSTERAERRTPQPQIETIMLPQFLERFYPRSISESVSYECFTSTVKLDLKQSALDPRTFEFKRTHDIDGLFAIFNINEFESIIKSPVQFLVFPSLVDRRTTKNITKLLTPRNECLYKAVKIGLIEMRYGCLDLIAFIESEISIDDKTFRLIAEQSSAFARSLPCAYDTDHYRTCRSGGVRNNHRANMRATTANHARNESEDYSVLIATCYVHHFNKAFKSKLAENRIFGNLKMFVKCIGSKSFTFTENIDDILLYIRDFEKAIDFHKIGAKNVWIDYCITTSAETEACPVWNIDNLSIFI